jgi:hypothetical protein
MKTLISIIASGINLFFGVYTFVTNDRPTDKVFFFFLELSAVSIWHLYDKYKNKFFN